MNFLDSLTLKEGILSDTNKELLKTTQEERSKINMISQVALSLFLVPPMLPILSKLKNRRAITSQNKIILFSIFASYAIASRFAYKRIELAHCSKFLDSMEY